MCAFDVQITTVNDPLSIVTLTSVCSSKECAHETVLHISTTAVAISGREFWQKINKLKGILSSPTSCLNSLFLGTATRRTILVPAASPMFGAVGNWSPPSPSASSPELPIDARLPGPWTAARPSIPADASHLLGYCASPCGPTPQTALSFSVSGRLVS